MQTGLVLHVPEAEPVVGPTRARYDPAARAGMPAHVTLIYPFMDSKAFDAEARLRLAAACAATPAMSLTFQTLGRFDDVLWLVPEPAAPVVALIRTIAAAFPDFPPYGGAFDEVVPHLTVAHGDAARFDRLEEGLKPKLATPFAAAPNAAILFGRSPEGWLELERYALGV